MSPTPSTFTQFRDAALLNTKNKNYDAALQQWSEARKLRPDNSQGYVAAANILILLKNPDEAEKICLEGIKNCKVPNQSLLLCLANIKKEQKDFPEAFKIWAELRQIYPANLPGYARAARLHLALKEYGAGMKMCEDALKNCPLPEITYSIMAQLKSAQKDYSGALESWAEVRRLKPYDAEGYRRAALVYMEMGKYDEADRLCEEAINNNAASIFLYQAYILCARKKKLPEKEKLQQVYERRLMLCRAYPDNFNELCMLSNTCHALQKYNPYLDLIGNYILSSIFERYNPVKIINKQIIDGTKLPKICFYSSTLNNFKYFVPVIKYICPCFIDIVIENPGDRDKELIREYDIEYYKILYGFDQIKNYDFIALDSDYLAQEKFYELPAKFITLPHYIALSPSLPVINRSSLCITMAGTEINPETVLPLPKLDEKNEKLLANIDISARCELTHTGPYHIGAFLRDHQERFVYRSLIAKKYGYSFDPKKPLVVFLQDDRCDSEQIVNCINSLDKYANIIVRPFSDSPSQFAGKLGKNIILYKDRTPVPETLLNSADFILAGFCSSLMETALVLGMNVIPYYSDIVTVHGTQKDYQEYLKTTEPVEKMRAKLLKKIKLFNLQDIKSITKAILNRNYTEWLHETLPTLKKEVFGEYLLDDAARQTADHIMRFALYGSIGKGCKAVYLRGEFFA